MNSCKCNLNLQHIFKKLSSITVEKFLIFVIFIGAIAIRINHPNRAPIDAHPMRQTDTYCVIHNFKTLNFNLLKPRACLIRPPANTKGFFFLELPLYQAVVSLFQILINNDSYWSIRLVNFSLFSLTFVLFYQGTKSLFDGKTALFQSLILAFSPSAIFFLGQAIHPDVMMLTALASAWYFLSRYQAQAQKNHFWWLVISLNIGVATRPYLALTLIPFAYLVAKRSSIKNGLIMFFGSGLLYTVWMLWQQQFPAANHSWQQWVFGQRRDLLKPAIIKKLVYKNLAGEVLGKVSAGLSLVGIGQLIYQHKNKLDKFLLIWIGLVPVYWLIVPAGNITHQYYAHVIFFPLILAAARFLKWGLEIVLKRIPARFAYSLLAMVCSLIVFNGWRTSRYFWIKRTTDSELQLAAEIQQTVPVASKLIYLGQSPLPLSLSLRQGWMTGYPPADLESTAKAVRNQFKHAEFVVRPNFDGTFPKGEWAQLKPQLNKVSETAVGTVYRTSE